jgi:hypothetical protein
LSVISLQVAANRVVGLALQIRNRDGPVPPFQRNI